MITSFSDIINLAKQRRKRMVIPCGNERGILEIVKMAEELGLIKPILIGEREKIKESLSSINMSRDDVQLVEGGGREEAVNQAVQMIQEGDADLLMQGAINTKEFLDMISCKGLMMGELLSYVSLFELGDRLMFLTDTYVNDGPDLSMKIEIVKNMIELGKLFGIENLKIAALSAIEYINPAIPSTVDSAVLSKMSERGQIEAIIEGPLDFDAACSKIAAKGKGVDSIVPGKADVFLFPEIESAYSFSHLLIFLFKIKMAGVLMGTKAPVILDDRMYTPEIKVLNIALGVLRCR